MFLIHRMFIKLKCVFTKTLSPLVNLYTCYFSLQVECISKQLKIKRDKYCLSFLIFFLDMRCQFNSRFKLFCDPDEWWEDLLSNIMFYSLCPAYNIDCFIIVIYYDINTCLKFQDTKLEAVKVQLNCLGI